MGDSDIQGGTEFGYTLKWVIVASDLMAMLLQTLSAKLRIATEKNLAEHCREGFPKPVSFGMWVLLEGGGGHGRGQPGQNFLHL